MKKIILSLALMAAATAGAVTAASAQPDLPPNIFRYRMGECEVVFLSDGQSGAGPVFSSVPRLPKGTSSRP